MATFLLRTKNNIKQTHMVHHIKKKAHLEETFYSLSTEYYHSTPPSYSSFFQRNANNIVFMEPYLYLGQHTDGDLRQDGLGHELVNVLT